MYWFDGVGRKNKFIYVAFALSLLIHGLTLLLLARNAAKDASVMLAFNSQATSIEVRLTPAQTKQAPLVKLQPDHVQSIEKPLPNLTSHSDGARKLKQTRRSAIPKLLDLKTGNQLNLSYWRGVAIQGRPVRIRLMVNPAGFIDKWELLTKVTMPLQLDPEALNVMVRNMDADKTGETHFLIWECQVGKKNGELIAKIYSASDKGAGIY